MSSMTGLSMPTHAVSTASISRFFWNPVSDRSNYSRPERSFKVLDRWKHNIRAKYEDRVFSQKTAIGVLETSFCDQPLGNGYRNYAMSAYAPVAGAILGNAKSRILTYREYHRRTRSKKMIDLSWPYRGPFPPGQLHQPDDRTPPGLTCSN